MLLFAQTENSLIFALAIRNSRHYTEDLIVAGRLAQLVQSIWFTPRGSGVRIPHRPQRKPKLIVSVFFMIKGVESLLSLSFNHKKINLLKTSFDFLCSGLPRMGSTQLIPNLSFQLKLKIPEAHWASSSYYQISSPTKSRNESFDFFYAPTRRKFIFGSGWGIKKSTWLKVEIFCEGSPSRDQRS